MRYFCSLVFLSLFFLNSAFAKKIDLDDSIKEKESKQNELVQKLNQNSKDLIKKGLSNKERSNLNQLKQDLILKKLILKQQLKELKKRVAQYNFSTNEKMLIKITPSKQCTSPCEITLEALPENRHIKNISHYIFHINNKKVISKSAKIKTTLYFSKSSLPKKQKDALSSSVPLAKVFHINADAFLLNHKHLHSRNIRLLVSAPIVNNNPIELLTKALQPMNRILIANHGTSIEQLKGTIEGQEIVFKKDLTSEDENILYAILPYFNKETAVLKISNLSFNIQIKPLTTVANPKTFLIDNINATNETFEAILANDKYTEALGTKAVEVFQKMNSSIALLKNYLNYASPEEIQLIANLIYSSSQITPELFSSNSTHRNEFLTFKEILPANEALIKALFSFSSILITSAHAQQEPNEDTLKEQALKAFLDSLSNIVSNVLTLGTTTLFDGMINKCYISKGRHVPSTVTLLENGINGLMEVSAAAIASLEGGLAGAIGYITGVLSSSSLVIYIGKDCDSGEFIEPKLIISSQPQSNIIPGETLNYKVFCDVNDDRYYDPKSELTKSSTYFKYLAPHFEEDSSLTSFDKLLRGCSGLGISPISNFERSILCPTNLLKDTQFYKDNKASYETFKKESCNGKSFYEVGMYLSDSPSISCNVMNDESNLNVVGLPTPANQLTFDLRKKWYCPTAKINYTLKNFRVTLDATNAMNKDIPELKFHWDLGDGTAERITSAPTLTYSYYEIGKYKIKLKVTGPEGAYDSNEIEIEVKPIEVIIPVYVMPKGTYLHVDSKDYDEETGSLPLQPSRFNLSDLYNNPNYNLKPGDFIGIKGSGEFQATPSWYGGSDINDGMIGVFDGGSFLYPGSDSVYNPIITPATDSKGEATDIPQDFDIDFDDYNYLQIPEGATSIIFSPLDNRFSDNSDPDSDYKALVKIYIVRSRANQ